MNAGLFYLLSLLAQVEVPLVNAPDGEQTLRKNATLSESMATIEKLHHQWKQLGDPAHREPGEAADRYHQRAVRSLKGKAYLLILLGDEYERVLQSRYAIAADLELFKSWIDAAAQSNAAIADRYRQESDDRKKKMNDLKSQVIVLAAMLYDKYSAEADQYRQSGEAEKAKEADSAAEAMQARAAKAVQIFKRKDIENQFSGLSTADMRQKFDDLGRQLISVDREARYVDQHVITEMPQLLENLDEAQKQSMKEGQELLAKTKDVEDLASDIPMVCKYLEDTLDQVQRYEGATARWVLQQRLQEVPRISKILVEFSGSTTTGSINARLDHILGLDDGVAGDAAPQVPK